MRAHSALTCGMCSLQLRLFGHEEPSFDRQFARVRRIELGGGAWIEYAPEWLSGAQTLFELLLSTTRFHETEQWLYERQVRTPRLIAALPEDGPGHPSILAMRDVLSERYAERFERVTLAYYRDGRDSVAFHGDRIARQLPDAVVATVSIGEPRRLLLRPRAGGKSQGFKLGSGDLFVMGGTCQRTFQHGVPKASHAGPRIALMFRPRWEE